MTSRLIFIGDIHGCIDEVTRLLDRLQPAPEDEVVAVGDLVDKGPDPEGVVELWFRSGYGAVMGNNEQRLLANLAKGAAVGRPNERLAIRSDLIEYLSKLPVSLDFPVEKVCAVHGGFFPDMQLEGGIPPEFRNDVTRMRRIRFENGRWTRVGKDDERQGQFWSELWNGDRTVVYGHVATTSRAPRIDSRAIGIDTGCVYGGWLTAAVHEDGQWRFEQVPSRRVHAFRWSQRVNALAVLGSALRLR